MRVLEVCVALDGGGIDRYLYNYCTHTVGVSYDFAVVDTGREGILEPPLRARGWAVYRVPRLRAGILRNARALCRIMRQGGYDAVHVHLGEKSLVALLCAKRCGIGVRIAHAHIADAPEGRAARVLRLLLRSLTRRAATALSACGERAGAFVWGERAMARGEVTLCRNALEIEAYAYSDKRRAAARAALGIDATAMVVGHVGRLCAQKNQLRLLEMFVEVLRRRSDAHLLLVGEGELREQIEQRAEALGIAERVILTGVREDVGALLCAMDVMMFPSTHEGLPFALLEAQCSGLPVVCSDAITREVALSDGVRFLPLVASDAEWAAEGCERAMWARCPADAQLRRAGYDVEREAAQLVELYRTK